MINIVTGISYYKNDSRLQGFNMNENYSSFSNLDCQIIPENKNQVI